MFLFRSKLLPSPQQKPCIQLWTSEGFRMSHCYTPEKNRRFPEKNHLPAHTKVSSGPRFYVDFRYLQINGLVGRFTGWSPCFRGTSPTVSGCFRLPDFPNNTNPLIRGYPDPFWGLPPSGLPSSQRAKQIGVQLRAGHRGGLPRGGDSRQKTVKALWSW